VEEIRRRWRGRRWKGTRPISSPRYEEYLIIQNNLISGSKGFQKAITYLVILAWPRVTGLCAYKIIAFTLLT
jgi:hypothetical protein